MGDALMLFIQSKSSAEFALSGTSLLPWILVTGALAALLAFVILNFRKKRILNKFNYHQIEKEIREKDLLHALINNMPDRIYIKDRKSRFLLANRHVASTMGVGSPEELIGKTDFEFFEAKIAEDYFSDEQRIMEQGIPMINKEEPGFDTEGNNRIISTTKVPLYGEKGSIVGIVGIGRDITELKENAKKLNEQTRKLRKINRLLRERQKENEQLAMEMLAQSEALRTANRQLEKLSLVASKTHNVVVIMDSNGNFEWVNQGFVDMTGYTMQEFTQKFGNNLRENSSNANISAILNQVYITREPFNYNSRITDKNGNVSWYQTNITPILDEDGYVDRLILIDTDISDLKRAENQIKQQKTEIERHRDTLRQLNATKDRLFSIIAHDLKNPFQSIIGFSELLRDEFSRLDSETAREYIEMIHQSSVNAFQLLQNLLDWSRSQLDQISIDRKRVYVKPLIKLTIELLHPTAKSKDIKLIDESSEKAFAFADSQMLSTVLQNLAGNAIKFTDSGGRVTFRTISGADTLKIKVIDTGVGMNREKIESLFNLEKINSTAGTAGEKGTGIGLLVCKEFVEKIGGSLLISSKPGIGTAITVALPRS
ncbi:MAG: PAS domain-containing protein [Bacteroidales bacterium]|nr:PAS domain-containing protein [Bacteroidales bacterium]